MHGILLPLLHGVLSSFRILADLQIEVMALRHKLEVLRRDRHTRIRLAWVDRIFWVLLYCLWPRCVDAVVLVKPDTVVR